MFKDVEKISSLRFKIKYFQTGFGVTNNLTKCSLVITDGDL